MGTYVNLSPALMSQVSPTLAGQLNAYNWGMSAVAQSSQSKANDHNNLSGSSFVSEPPQNQAQQQQLGLDGSVYGSTKSITSRKLNGEGTQQPQLSMTGEGDAWTRAGVGKPRQPQMVAGGDAFVGQELPVEIGGRYRVNISDLHEELKRLKSRGPVDLSRGYTKSQREDLKSDFLRELKCAIKTLIKQYHAKEMARIALIPRYSRRRWEKKYVYDPDMSTLRDIFSDVKDLARTDIGRTDFWERAVEYYGEALSFVESKDGRTWLRAHMLYYGGYVVDLHGNFEWVENVFDTSTKTGTQRRSSPKAIANAPILGCPNSTDLVKTIAKAVDEIGQVIRKDGVMPERIKQGKVVIRSLRMIMKAVKKNAEQLELDEEDLARRYIGVGKLFESFFGETMFYDIAVSAPDETPGGYKIFDDDTMSLLDEPKKDDRF